MYFTVYIVRSGNTFNEAVSVGYNETWVMTRVADILEERNQLMLVSINGYNYHKVIISAILLT